MALTPHSATQTLQPEQSVLSHLPNVSVYTYSRAASLTAVSVTRNENAYFLF